MNTFFENKLSYLKESKLSDSSKKIYLIHFKKINVFEEKFNKDLKDFTIDEIKYFLISTQSSSFKTLEMSLSIIKKYRKKTNLVDEDYSDIVLSDIKNESNNYISLDEFNEKIFSKLKNATPTDKLMVYLLRCGVTVKELTEITLRNISEKSIELYRNNVFIHLKTDRKLGRLTYKVILQNKKSDIWNLIQTENGKTYSEQGIRSRINILCANNDIEAISPRQLNYSYVLDKVREELKGDLNNLDRESIGEVLKTIEGISNNNKENSLMKKIKQDMGIV